MEPERSGASSAMSHIMDPSSRDGIKGSLRGSSAPFSPDTDGDVDGDPVQPSVDLELARKKKELEVIEEKIARKKAVLATRQLKHGAKDMPKEQTVSTTVKGISKQTKINNTIFKTYNHVTDKSSRLPLKRRVLDILSKFRRTPVRYLLRKLKKQNKMRALELKIRAPLENEEAHPLRLRVKVLMNQRRSPNNEVVPDDKQHNPTIQRPVHSLRTQEKDIAATGFQRFLNVLNEGVDINKLSKIVNDENELLVVGEELPQVWPTLLEGHVDSSSRSKSSPVEEKVVRLEDEQRYEQMQTLLEIVGLDLGVEELGRLTDRTNDRLYGKMGDLKGKENEKGKEKKESEPSLKHLSTSTLPSDSASPSPLLNQHSNITVEYSSSSNRVWDIERHRDKSERDWHRHSGTRDEDREREEDIVREMERSERDGERDGHRDREREDSAREGDSPTRERYRQRCSSTRDKDRVRERDRSERNRKGDGHRHSSTRERDKDIPVVRETNRSERNRDKDRDRDPEKDCDGGRERDRDRSGRDRGRYRFDRDPEKGRDGGREKARDRVRDRDRYRSERERNREIDKDIERWLQRTRDKSSRARDWDSESDWNSHSSTRDWDRARSERDWYGDESRESSIEFYSYSMDPIFPVSHPHPFMMANYSPTWYSQYMTYHSSPYTIAFPPGWGYPPVTMPPGIMPAGAMLPSNKPLLPNPPGDPPYPSAPPYYSYGTAALNQTYAYTQPASNLQLSSTQSASNLQLSSTQPASNLHLSSTQPASNLQLSYTQPTSNLQLSYTQPATSNLHLSYTQPATSNLHLSSTQPASNLQLSSTQPASNLQLSSTQPASNLQLTSTQPATSNLHLSSTQPASTAAVLPVLRNPPICHKKLAPWYKEKNHALKQICRQMERKWRSTNLEVFQLAWKDSKRQYRKALNAARLAYFSNQIEENKNNPKCILDVAPQVAVKDFLWRGAQDPEGEAMIDGENLHADTVEEVVPKKLDV
ncbi:uncharacterized protein LOC115208666 [Salmo trutta]|uniref:uncharacterized protein LOC115208666 n=1 Tax=Salmo trutta TaxID=8032 RepID=UPI00113227A8|nr:uncharacterized protein LOC115208666 [Salmo trutta]XP_029632762.1 uncharacterized protein LOC115208666 [Salmo trutta]XP_029632763.1 uncharacterized protein LOC115208666 [Salmo trutta]